MTHQKKLFYNGDSEYFQMMCLALNLGVSKEEFRATWNLLNNTLMPNWRPFHRKWGYED